jgi:hypothetical protein
MVSLDERQFQNNLFPKSLPKPPLATHLPARLSPKKGKKKKKKIIDHILINISNHLVVGPSILTLL